MQRSNEEILEERVLVIDENGINLGNIATFEAIKLARSKGLDLIEVGRGVCKIQNLKKYLYHQKKAHKSKPAPELKEFRFGVNIAQHDLEIKVNHINELIEKGHPIRIVIRFRGRETVRPEKGTELFESIVKLLVNSTHDEPKREGNQLISTIRKDK